MDGGADAGDLDAGMSGEAALGTEADDPYALGGGEPFGDAGKHIGAQFLEGPGQVRHLDLEMDRNGRGAFGRLGRHRHLVDRPGAVALLAGLQPDIVEVGIAEVAEEARGGRLGNAGEAGELGRGEGQDLVRAVEEEASRASARSGSAPRTGPGSEAPAASPCRPIAGSPGYQQSE